MTKLNGVQRGAEVSKSFQTWFDERQKLGDVSEYLNARGRLRIPTYPRSHSNNIRAPIPGYPRGSDALP
ncbi:hypothetical protein SAMN04488056_1361 [Cohaesibacter marisflavi]|uniref:Uncharacterized protein n=1 Tax=Cohaesibacter marisflavi TaxID=655353 RepID=A0A1I5NNJ2_9HYPH|nr:hypothetical protein [Cohaesibacter marisflavi]SFP22896.1 hypothetical protein SAMN04488056_1361 [Cohaesibacter marisflavi]